MFQSLRERLALTLVVLLPFHALAVTVLTRLIDGPGRAPIGILALWKEALLGVILLVTVIEWLAKRSSPKKFDIIDGFILVLILLSVGVTAMSHGDWKLYLFGFKYDFVPLVALLFLRRADWSEWFRDMLPKVLITTGIIVAAYALLTFVLPMRWFTMLGYSDLHSMYLPDGPLAAFQQIGASGIRRVQGSFSGPNQLGIWLLIPLGLLLSSVKSRAESMESNSKKKFLLSLCFLLFALTLTFSRASWVAAFVIILVSHIPLLRGRVSQKTALTAVTGVMCLVLLAALLFPAIFLRVSSSRGHIEKPLAALQTMMTYGLGSGLGIIGPASNRVSDACVMLEAGSDASWAADRPNLCVFIGDEQVQPAGKICRCPNVSENWYLQIGVELGVLGFVLYLALIWIVLRRLRKTQMFLPFVGISIAALFLHAWEDSAVAYTGWLLVAVILRNATRAVQTPLHSEDGSADRTRVR